MHLPLVPTLLKEYSEVGNIMQYYEPIGHAAFSCGKTNSSTYIPTYIHH
jgi:hypothetical protein